MRRFATDYWPELVVGIVLFSFVFRRVREWLTSASRWWFKSVAGWVKTTVPIGMGAMAVAVQVIFGNEPTPARIHGAIASAMLTVLAVGFPLLNQASAERVASEAIERLNYDFGRTLQPLTAAIKQVTEATGQKKQQAKGSAKTVALTAASSLIGGPQDIRANYYEVQGTMPNRILSPARGGSIGRPDTARTVFREETLLGGGIFAALDENSWAYCPSMSEAPPSGWPEGTVPIWKSFLSVPVTSRNCVIGMLTVDSKSERDFNPDQDPYLLFTIAHLLAVAEGA